ncbi:substrate-binding and VWA domain-containing protein [Ornithinimicrobium sp. Arc0846-15]|nr:substrate-binding and VWA domain-containing protein [Ornithinimicrobium laminariae]
MNGQQLVKLATAASCALLLAAFIVVRDDVAQGPGSASNQTLTPGDARQSPCPDASGSLVVWVAPSATDPVQTLLEPLAACFDISVKPVNSAQALVDLTDSSTLPDIWIPDSAVWAALAESEGVALTTGPALATSPVVLAAPKDYGEAALADAGLSDTPGWQELLASSQPLLRVGQPTQDPASLAVVATALHNLDATGADSIQRDALLVQLSQQVLPSDPPSAAQSGQEAFVPFSEQSLALASVDKDAAPLTVLSPVEGAGELTYPFATFDRDDDAADAIRALLTEDEASQVWAAAGLRAGEDGDPLAIDGIPVELPESPVFAASEVAALMGEWASMSPIIQVLVMVDVSGSMDTVVGDDGQTRIDVTTETIAAAMSGVSAQSRIGLWWFSTNRGPGGRDWQEEEPIRSLDAPVRDGTQLDALLVAAETADETFTTGDTGLHDTLIDGYETLLREYDEDYHSSLVMLTDGTNDDPLGGLSEDETIARLGDLQDENRPLDVVLIGIGPDVDQLAMTRLAESLGGRFIAVSDIQDLEPMMVQFFAERPEM